MHVQTAKRREVSLRLVEAIFARIKSMLSCEEDEKTSQETIVANALRGVLYPQLDVHEKASLDTMLRGVFTASPNDYGTYIG